MFYVLASEQSPPLSQARLSPEAIRGEELPDHRDWVGLMQSDSGWPEYRCTHALPLVHQHTQMKQSASEPDRFCLPHAAAEPKSLRAERSEQHASSWRLNHFQGAAPTSSCCSVTLHIFTATLLFLGLSMRPDYLSGMCVNPLEPEENLSFSSGSRGFKWIMLMDDKRQLQSEQSQVCYYQGVFSLTQRSSASLWKTSRAPLVRRDRKHSQHTVSIFLFIKEIHSCLREDAHPSAHSPKLSWGFIIKLLLNNNSILFTVFIYGDKNLEFLKIQNSRTPVHTTPGHVKVPTSCRKIAFRGWTCTRAAF